MRAPHHGGGYRRLTMLIVLTCLALGLASSAAQAGPTLRGVQVHALWPDVSTADMDRELDLLRDAHANVVRVDVGWASLEDEAKGRWNSWYLPRLDRLVAGAEQRGMKVIMTLWGTPCWASSAPASIKQGCANPNWWGEGVQYPPADHSHFTDIARFVTARYGTKLAALEIWNEPNEGKRFINAPDHAVAYARLLKAGFAGARAGDPAVPVLAGALAKADGSFLARLYAAGIRGHYDGLSIHPYNEWRAPADDGETALNSFRGGIAAVHAQQRAAGDDTSLWITEFGWTTARGTNWQVTQGEQADYVAQAFGVLDTLPYVRAATVYELRDRSADPDDFESNFGLVAANYAPKPVYHALKAALGRLALGITVSAPAPAPAPVPAPSPATAPALAPAPSSATAPAQAPASPRVPTPVPRKPAKGGTKHQGALSVSARRRARIVEAVGRAQRGAIVSLTTRGCGSAGARRTTVRAGVTGHFRRSLPNARALRSCRVTAAFAGLVATARVV